ncbi:MAG: radical SAM protein, partial [Deltaproteobacteria bacterium]|nr:radical SAM protein [Deltaproteobacteria bacterium]
MAREKGAIIKEPGGKISIGLVFPNRYFVAMSHLGFQFLYHLLNRYKNVVCERIFLPEKDDIKEFLRTLSLLFSLESQRPINDFDALAFTLPFEMDFINILTILK